MFIEIILCILFGVTSGIFTGLTPGIHINLISLIIISFSPILINYLSPVSLGIFIISMAITHTFLDSLPGIYLGAPDESQILNALPGHKMLMDGEGHNAVKLTVIGSAGCLLIALLCFPITIRFMKFAYPLIKDSIGYILIVIMVYMIIKEKKLNKILKAFLMFLMSGVFGLIVLNIPTLNQPLFPLLSGAFGISLLTISLMDNTSIPEQDITKELTIKKSVIASSTLAGTFVATIAGFLPGFGSSQAAILGQQILGLGTKIGLWKDIDSKGFLIMVGGINTANMLTSIATVYVLGKARNGAIIAINKILETANHNIDTNAGSVINIRIVIIFLFSILVAAGIASILALKISKIFSKVIVKVNYTLLVSTIIIFIIILTTYFDGFLGLAILITSTAIGILATKLNVGKNHLMGCLILPVICYFVL
ncbi:MAG: tripartite tricarboxylate transporter permease [Candidatus Woesearchaeota archaeon]